MSIHVEFENSISPDGDVYKSPHRVHIRVTKWAIGRSDMMIYFIYKLGIQFVWKIWLCSFYSNMDWFVSLRTMAHFVTSICSLLVKNKALLEGNINVNNIEENMCINLFSKIDSKL